MAETGRRPVILVGGNMGRDDGLDYRARLAAYFPQATFISIEGDPAALELDTTDDIVRSATYPDALARIWSSLRCRQSGEIVLSAKPGYEFTDWGGVAHVGGGSHGSLHRGDSLGVLLYAGTGPREVPPLWRIRDVTPMVLDHFAVDS